MYKSRKHLIFWILAVYLCNQVSYARDDDLKYEDAGNYIIITGYDGSSSSVKIPANIEGKPVTSIESGAFRFNDDLSQITLPKTLEDIGRGALAFCHNLKAIKVNSGNPKFTSEKGILFNKDKTILFQAPGAFSGSYVVPDGVTEIGKDAFAHCKNLKKVVLPSGIKVIGDQAFMYCKKLKEVNLPKGLTTIRAHAFSSCPLSEVTIPVSVSEIDVMAFLHCRLLNDLQIESGNPYFYSKDNSIFTKDGSSLISCPANFSGTYKIPAHVTKIRKYAFHSCNKLTDVHIPEGVASIGSRAFCSCTGLEKVTFPSSLESLDSEAFRGCSDMEDVYFLGDAPGMGRDVFVSCASSFQIHYKENANGFTSPQWKGYSSKIYR